VLAVVADGRAITEVAVSWGISRQTLHTWLTRYEQAGLDGLVDPSHRPDRSPAQMAPELEVVLLETRRAHPGLGPTRLVYELARRGLVISRSGVYRALVRAGLIESGGRRRRQEYWRRWERGRAMELWQMDVVGGFVLADGRSLKCLTGIDDHSRFCVCATLLIAERTQPVCDALTCALIRHGVPEQILTDNGKVFTGRFNHPPTEVLFDAICRRNGIEHLLTQPRSPTTTGKIDRFHRSLRAEFLTAGTVFADLPSAQDELDELVAFYNQDRPHESLDMAVPAARFTTAAHRDAVTVPDRSGPDWVARNVSTVGVVCVSWQQVSVGVHRAGEPCDVLVGPDTLQFWIGNELLHRGTHQQQARPQQATPGRCPGQDQTSTLTPTSVKDHHPNPIRQPSPGTPQAHSVLMHVSGSRMQLVWWPRPQYPVGGRDVVTGTRRGRPRGPRHDADPQLVHPPCIEAARNRATTVASHTGPRGGMTCRCGYPSSLRSGRPC
jgi:transposase InsO family protein